MACTLKTSGCRQRVRGGGGEAGRGAHTDQTRWEWPCLPPQTPYCGFVRDGDDNLKVAPSAAHVLVSGPTEIGKSRRIPPPLASRPGGLVVRVVERQ